MMNYSIFSDGRRAETIYKSRTYRADERILETVGARSTSSPLTWGKELDVPLADPLDPLPLSSS